jgi:hypothetical protein
MKYAVSSLIIYPSFRSSQDLIVHSSISVGSWLSSGRSISAVGIRTSLPVVCHLGIELLRGLLGWARVATTTSACACALATSSCTCSLCWNSGLRLGLGLCNTLAQTLWRWKSGCTASIKDDINLKSTLACITLRGTCYLLSWVCHRRERC